MEAGKNLIYNSYRLDGKEIKRYDSKNKINKGMQYIAGSSTYNWMQQYNSKERQY